MLASREVYPLLRGRGTRILTQGVQESMTVIKVRMGESIDKALRALKKRLDKEGVMKSIKAHRFYSKPSIKKRAKAKAALKYKRQR